MYVYRLIRFLINASMVKSKMSAKIFSLKFVQFIRAKRQKRTNKTNNIIQLGKVNISVEGLNK